MCSKNEHVYTPVKTIPSTSEKDLELITQCITIKDCFKIVSRLEVKLGRIVCGTYRGAFTRRVTIKEIKLM